MVAQSLSDLSADLQAEIVRLIAASEYQVLLGAGASADSLDAKHRALPLAQTLAEELCDHFGLARDSDLRMAYERAQRSASSDEVYQYLHSRLTRTQPASWYETFCKLPWNRIWNLNLDDVLKRAYRRHAAAETTLRAISWDEPYEETSGLQAVYLHGRVWTETPQQLIFSILEYLYARDKRHSWHSILGDVWGERPFLLIGASLRDELDLVEVIRTAERSDGLPSLYVSRSIDDLMAADLEAWGLIPIETDAGTFFKELAPLVRSALERVRGPLGPATSSHVSAFMQQFRYLHSTRVDPSTGDHDLYRGDQPKWSDIVEDNDAAFRWPLELAGSAAESYRAGEQAVHAAIGSRFTGKSTGLLRAARELEREGFAPFLFRNEEALDPREVVRVLSETPSSILLFDGLADHSSALGRVLELCRTDGRAGVAVAVEREVRLPVLLSDLGGRFFRPAHLQEIEPVGATYRATRQSRMMYREDAESLVAKLRHRGRLGTFEGRPDGWIVERFQRVGIFAGLEEASQGIRFRNRISELTDRLSGRQHRLLVTVVTLVDTLGYPSPSLVVDAVEGTTGAAVDFDTTEIRELLLVGRDRVEARHRSVGLNPLLARVPKAELADAIVGVHRHLRPYVNDRTMAAGARHALVARGLMRARSLSHWIGTEQLREFFSELESLYGEWNPRYWEQRAIASELSRDWEAAESFAARAATDAPDEKRLTTLASVLIRRAQHDAEPGSSRSRLFLNRSLEQYRAAHARRPQNLVPVLACLSGILRLAGHYVKAGVELPEGLQHEWNRWLGDAATVQSVEFGPVRRQLDDMNFKWMRLVADQ